MRSIAYLPILACMILGSSGCARATATPTAVPTAAGHATLAAHPTKTLAAPATAAQPTATAGPGQEVDITVSDASLTSSLTTFHAGVPYNFVVKNTGSRELCFDINPPANVTGSASNSRAAALFDIPQNRLPPGTTVTESFTFPSSAVGAHLEFSCLERHAYDDKVRLPITVVQ